MSERKLGRVCACVKPADIMICIFSKRNLKSNNWNFCQKKYRVCLLQLRDSNTLEITYIDNQHARKVKGKCFLKSKHFGIRKINHTICATSPTHIFHSLLMCVHKLICFIFVFGNPSSDDILKCAPNCPGGGQFTI